MSNIIKEEHLHTLARDIEHVYFQDFAGDKLTVKQSFEAEREETFRLRSEADEVVRHAKVQANTLARDAEKKAEGLLAEAEQKTEEYRKEGFAKGYEEGKLQARTEVEQEFSQKAEEEFAQIKKVIEAFSQSYKDVIKNSEHALVKLALDIAAKVIRQEAAKNSDVVVRMIQDGLSRVVEKANITIRVNPEQLAVVKNHKDRLLAVLEGINDFGLVQDPKVGLGGCIIETNSGSVEVRIDKQLHEIKKALTGEDKEEEDVSANA